MANITLKKKKTQKNTPDSNFYFYICKLFFEYVSS